MKMYAPPHPGEILRKDYLVPLGITVTDAAKMLGIGRQALSSVLGGKAGISVSMALKLAKACKTSPELWLNLQKQHDLWFGKQKVDLSKVKVFNTAINYYNQ